VRSKLATLSIRGSSPERGTRDRGCRGGVWRRAHDQDGTPVASALRGLGPVSSWQSIPSQKVGLMAFTVTCIRSEPVDEKLVPQSAAARATRVRSVSALYADDGMVSKRERSDCEVT
jgi:hypothetical protein